MELLTGNNQTRLCGVIAGRPAFSHVCRGQAFCGFPLEIERLSGAVDRVPVLLRASLLERLEIRSAGKLCVTGELRSFNNRGGEGARLVLSVFVRAADFCDEPDSNLVRLTGTLCRAPNLRCTPKGREICDLLLAVNRPYGRSDYLPCICWGRLARQAASRTVGDKLRLSGRLQSRSYTKLTEDGPVERTAYEVSVSEAELLE